MLLTTLQRRGRSAFDTSSFLFGPAVDGPAREPLVDLHSLKARLHEVQVLARPAAVRLRDGVAVRLTYLSEVRREIALRREIHARALMVSSRAGA